MKKIFSVTIIFIFCAISVFSLLGCNSSFKKVATPTGFSQKKEKQRQIVEGDYYVSPNGNDENNGTKAKPFATVEKAKQIVRERMANKDIQVGGFDICVMAGTYQTTGLIFDSEDSGTAECPIRYHAYGDGEVFLNGGVALDNKDFEAVSGKQKDRLNPDIASKIVSVDLSKYGISEKDYGNLYAIGAYNNAAKYTGDTTGANACELFGNNKRMTLARYPNKNDLKTGKTVDNGYAYEAPIGTYHEEWNTAVNPRGGTFKIDSKTNKRIKTWDTLNDVWMFGYFYWDWADMSTPIASFDGNKSQITTKYCSTYGFKKGADYYFYNVFEELDCEGEYYLDRENGILYVYAGENFDSQQLQLSLTTNPIVKLEDCDYLTFDGFALSGSRSDGINIVGNHNTVVDCKVTNVAANGISVKGSNNIVSACDVSRSGQSGIILDGGDLETLTKGNNIADNNLIYNIGEIFKTYKPAINLLGVGNTATHNEIHDTPHIAIGYSGPKQRMAYNNIYNAVLNSTDAGAIYAGRSLSFYGCEIEYNAIYNIGSGKFAPDAIYFDDALAGQKAYGNLIVNAPKIGILIGGGRDVEVSNNLIINAKTPIYFDDRAYDGFNNKGWYANKVEKPDSSFWQLMNEAKRLNTQWKNAFPQIENMHGDFAKSEDKNFAVNPTNTIVSKNITLSSKGKIGILDAGGKKYGKIEKNSSYKLKDIGFGNYKKGNYNFTEQFLLNNDFFVALPIGEMGRY